MLRCDADSHGKQKYKKYLLTLFILTYGSGKRCRGEMVQLCVIKYQPKGGICKMGSSTITWVRQYVVYVDLLIEAVRDRNPL